MKALLRRPSPALVISSMALFISLSGVSYGVATGFIDSREIKDNTIRSKDIRNNVLRTFDIRNNEVRGFDIRNSTIRGRDVALNTLTGADISENDLAKVPSAAAADTATDATTVGGMSVGKFFSKPAPASAPAEVFRGATFAIKAGCNAAGEPVVQLDGLAGAAVTNVTVQGNGTDAGPGGGPYFRSEVSLGPGDNLDLLNGATTANTRATGTAVLSATDGRVATIAFGAVDASAFTGENVCAARGTVVSG